MKTVKIVSFAFIVLLILLACKKEEPEVCYCEDSPFVYNYIGHCGFSTDYLEDYIANYITDSLSLSLSKYPITDDYLNSIRNHYYTCLSYFIKGVVIDKADNVDYGVRVRILDDLKGNMPDSSLITVWGNKGTNKRVDILTQYAKNDTLLLLLSTDYGSIKTNDFRTVTCAWSDGNVLQYANGFVTGFIHSLSGEMETMLWSDLQEELIGYLTRERLL